MIPKIGHLDPSSLAVASARWRADVESMSTQLSAQTANVKDLRLPSDCNVSKRRKKRMSRGSKLSDASDSTFSLFGPARLPASSDRKPLGWGKLYVE